MERIAGHLELLSFIETGKLSVEKITPKEEE